MDAYLLSHNGLGDNLFMIGAINFLKQFYKNIYFICKLKYYDNVKLFFDINSNVICVPIKHINEFDKIYLKIIQNKNIDLLFCGKHIKKFKTRINNKYFLNSEIVDKNYTIDFSTLNSINYKFIENFYKNIRLNLTYFYEYFDLPSTDISKKMFENVSKYYLIFIQYKSSNGKTLNISNLKKKYINDDNVLLLCNDENLYSIDQKIKYNLAQEFVFKKIIYYYDTIKNCDEIYLIDSCFTGIVLPLLKTNRLKTKNIKIILRNISHKILI
jgi:hypothetical protein